MQIVIVITVTICISKEETKKTTPEASTITEYSLQQETINEFEEELAEKMAKVKYTLENQTKIPEYALESFPRIDGIATAYTLHPSECGGKTPDHPEYGITYSGRRVKVGRTVAVDPKVIPLGSVLYVELASPYEHLSGTYVAEDIGSGVKGKHIDVYIGEDKENDLTIFKEAYRFGIRDATIYILEKGKGKVDDKIVSRGYSIGASISRSKSDRGEKN